MTITVNGADEALKAVKEVVQALTDQGALHGAIYSGAKEAAKAAEARSPYRTGTLAHAHTVGIQGLHASIYIDPSAQSPSGGRPEVYGPIVARRQRDFYAETANTDGDRIAEKVFQELIGRLPR